jgi:hypothetical protein
VQDVHLIFKSGCEHFAEIPSVGQLVKTGEILNLVIARSYKAEDGWWRCRCDDEPRLSEALREVQQGRMKPEDVVRSYLVAGWKVEKDFVDHFARSEDDYLPH